MIMMIHVENLSDIWFGGGGGVGYRIFDFLGGLISDRMPPPPPHYGQIPFSDRSTSEQLPYLLEYTCKPLAWGLWKKWD